MKEFRRSILAVFCLVVSLGVSLAAFAQPGHLTKQAVDEAVEGSKLEMGPLRVTPFFVMNTGYDSNSLSSSDFPEEDVTLRAGPGAVFVLPLARRGYFRVTPELNYVYYREQSSLRNLNKQVNLSGVFGSRRMLFEIDTDYASGIARPTSEFDVPVEVREIGTRVNGRMLLGWRQILSAYYAVGEYGVEGDSAELGQDTLDARLGRKTQRVGLELERFVSSRTSLVLDGFRETLDFDDLASRDATTIGFAGGFAFGTIRSGSGGRGMFGRAVLGYEKTEPDSSGQADFSGLTANVNAGFAYRTRDRVTVLFGRGLSASVLEDNWFFVGHRVGVTLTTYLHPRFFLSPGVYYNRNSYPRPELVQDEAGELGLGDVRDRQWNYRLGMNFHLSEEIVFQVNLDYLQRESNFDNFEKNRFLVGAGVSVLR